LNEPEHVKLKVIKEVIKVVLLVYFTVALIYMVNNYQRIGFVSDRASSVIDKNIGNEGK
jgi:hypothetical protein